MTPKKLTADELSRIDSEERGDVYDGLARSKIRRLLTHIAFIEQENAKLTETVQSLGQALKYAAPILNRCGITQDTLEGMHLRNLWARAGADWKDFLSAEDRQAALAGKEKE